MTRVGKVEVALIAVGLLIGAVGGTAAATVTRGPAATSAEAPPSGVDRTRNPTELHELARTASVRIDDDACDGRRSGTGVAISAGLVLTAGHVVAGDTTARITGVDGAGGGWGILRSTVTDLATVTADVGLHPLERASADPARGTPVVVAGAPGGGVLEVRDARVVNYLHGSGPHDPPVVMRLDVPARPGDSGGPVIDQRGRLVGIVYSRAAVDGSTLVIPISVVNSSLATLSSAAPEPCPGG